MKNFNFWVGTIVVLVGIILTVWGVSIWLAGCTSTVQEEIGSTTTITTSTTSRSSTLTTSSKNSTTTWTTFPTSIPTTMTTTTLPVGVWIEQTPSAAFSPREGHTSLLFDSRMWVIGGGTYGPPYGHDVWYSTNGKDWFLATGEAGFIGRKFHASVIFDNKMWVIGGYNGSNNLNDVWYSSDGVNWTLATAEAGFSGRSGHGTVVFNNKLWVVGGGTFDGGFNNRLNDVWSSLDGISWTREVVSAPFAPRADHTSVVYDGKIWVIGGFPAFNDVWYSSNGTSWEAATTSAAFDGRGGHASVVYDNKIWVIGGDAGGVNPYRNDVWSSANGKDWTEEAYSGFPGRRYLSSIITDKIWIMGGYSPTMFYNDVWYYP